MSQAGIITETPLPPLVETLTGNFGPAVPPDSDNNINVVGSSTIMTIGSSAIHTITIEPTVNGYPITPYVVGPAGQAGYQTIQLALTAANAAGGGMVWVQPGLYNENLTLYDKTQIIAAVGFSDYGNTVQINGVHTPPTSGSFTFRNCYLTSSTDIFNSNAAGTATLDVSDCAVGVANGFLYNLPNWTGNLLLWDVNSSFGTNDGCVNNSGGSLLLFFQAGMGAGSGQTMIASGPVIMGGCQASCPINFINSANLSIDGSQFTNTVNLLDNSTGYLDTCHFISGSSVAITMISNSPITISNCTINTTHNPAIDSDGTGFGTLTLSGIEFINNSTVSNQLQPAYGTTRTGNAYFPQGQVVNVITASGNFTTDATMYFLGIQTSLAITVTLMASPIMGQTYRIADITGSAMTHNITIVGNGHNIDGASTKVINVNYGSVDLVFTGTIWKVV